MRRYPGWLVFVAMVASTLVLGTIAMSNGELELYLFIIFPVLRAEGAWGALAMLTALASFVMLLVNLRYVISLDDDRKVSGGGVLLIGPLPIVFGTDRPSTIVVLLITVAVLATLLFLLLL